MAAEFENKIRDLLCDKPVLEPPDVPQAVYDKFCAIFLESVPEIVATIRLQKNDSDALRKAAHRVKGACGFAGAVHMRILAAELESTVETIDNSRLDYLIQGLENSLTETTAAMLALRGSV